MVRTRAASRTRTFRQTGNGTGRGGQGGQDNDQGASSGGECVVALAACGTPSWRGARVSEDDREIFWRQAQARLRPEVAVAKVCGHDLWPGVFTQGEIDHLRRKRWTGQPRAPRWNPGGRDAASNTTSHLPAAGEQIGGQVREVDHQLAGALRDILTGAGLLPGRVALVEEPATRRPS